MNCLNDYNRIIRRIHFDSFVDIVIVIVIFDCCSESHSNIYIVIYNQYSFPKSLFVFYDNGTFLREVMQILIMALCRLILATLRQDLCRQKSNSFRLALNMLDAKRNQCLFFHVLVVVLIFSVISALKHLN